MAPFGPGNMQPTFMTRAMRHDGRVRVLKETHLKLVVSKSGSKSLDAIALKNHPAILMWCLGNETNYSVDQATWAAALETAAQWIHANDPNHLVTTAHGEVPTASYLSACPSVDVWGMNVYRGTASCSAPIGDWIARNVNKPCFFSELGVDSYNHNKPGVDEASQGTGLSGMWADIKYSIDNNQACSGVTYFEFSDEWWKSGNPSTHDLTGSAPGSFYPDSYTDEEYYGIVNIDRTKKSAFTTLTNLWASYCVAATPYTAVLEDAECYRNIDYWNYDGGFAVVANPSTTGNTSASVIKYDRSQIQYPAIIGTTTLLEDVSPALNQAKLLQLDVYSAYPGKSIQITLQNSAKAKGTYPAGRHSIYTATTTKTNAWETLSFAFNSQPDATVKNTEIDEIALLFEPGDATSNHTFYFDNLKGPVILTTTDVGVKSLVAPAASGCFTTAQTVTVKLHNYDSKAINFVNNPVTINLAITGAASGTFTKRVATGTLAAGADLNVDVTTAAQLNTAGTYKFDASSVVSGDNNCTNNKMSQASITSSVCTGLEDLSYSVSEFYIAPNPVTNVATISYNVHVSSDITLEVFDVLGNKVSTILTQNNAKGVYTTEWHTENIASGLYFVKLTGQSGVKTTKVIVSK